jgi:signal transduction histidine kinase
MITLDSSKLFGQLPATELKQLSIVTRELQFSPGQQIFKEGDPGDGVYVVKSGQVQISGMVPPGERRVFSRLQPGDFFGEMAVLDNQTRSACASAEGEATVYFVPRKEMMQLLSRSAGLSVSLLQAISLRVREFNQQYLREVLQAERLALVGRFASSVVHDLKNPLTIISLAAEVACTGSSTVEVRQSSLQRINRQLERVTSMVNDILEFTRGAPARPALALFSYGPFVRNTIDEMQAEVARKSVHIEFDNPPPEIKLSINPQRLTRVFYNLILNAVDEMPGGGKIRLRFDVRDDEVVSEIVDSGEGIAPEIIDRLFEPFATYGKAKGTGLGLSISRRIIEEHGGKISATNSPGGGAIFAFTLPKPKGKRDS